MKNKKLLIIVGLLLGQCFAVNAQATFKVMFYNLLNYPNENTFPNRDNDLQLILEDYEPDLFLVCELNNQTGANILLGITKSAITTNYEMATFATNTSDDNNGNNNDLQNLLYYDASKFILESQTIVPTTLRDFNVYKLKLNTVNQASNPVELYVVVCHLKASSGSSNEAIRFQMVQELDTYLNTLPANANVLLGGDLNLYSANESAFQELLDGSNYITFADPVNRIGSWNNNPNFIDVFTQSTRTQSGLGGASGGFDSRFDFILTSENMLSAADITYVPNSYKVYGNNITNSCYNKSINSSDCAGSDYTFAIRDALYNFSDHLPVIIRLQTAETLLSTTENSLENYPLVDKTIVSETLTINTQLLKPNHNEFAIYNSLGKKVISFSTNQTEQYKVDISELSNGIYYLTTLNSKLKPVKFIKIVE